MKSNTAVFVGPGAIGCLFAALTKESGKDVWLLDKRADRARQIAANGICVESEAGVRIVPMNISANPKEIGKARFVFLTVKSYDTAAALVQALPLIGSGTLVISLQNGAGNIELIAKHVPGQQIGCCVTSHGATLLAPGRIRHAGKGPTSVASFENSSTDLASIVREFLTGGGIEAAVAGDAQSLIWSKLVINAAINPVTALADVPNGQLLEDRELHKTMRQAALEAAQVARTKGIGLAYQNEVAETERVCRLTAANISSMLQDIRNGRRTEIDAINGWIVAEAKALGVAVPTNSMLLELVREKAAGQR